MSEEQVIDLLHQCYFKELSKGTMNSHQGPSYKNKSSQNENENKISDLRKEIDVIDSQLLVLLDQRAGIVAQVGEVKRSMDKQIHDPSRETTILNRIIKEPHVNLRDAEVHSLFQKLIEYYRSIEKVQTLRNSAQLPTHLKVGFYGFGLISGSIGLSLAESFPHWDYLVYDPHIDEGEFKKWGTSSIKKRFQLVKEDALNNLDLVFLGAPISVNEAKASALINKNTIVLNLGSVQTNVNNLYGFHPLAGKEESGFWVTQPDLFYGKVICLTNTENLTSDQLHFLKQLAFALGAEPWVGSAQIHNEKLAYSSHLIQLIAMALGFCLEKQEFNLDLNLIPKTAKDFLRLTGSSQSMWEAILEKNQGNILQAINNFELELKNIKLKISNKEDIKALFNQSYKIYNELYKQGSRS